ncbi:hypothetical protein [Sphaerisporangium aureirubrum]|uniref:Uncharacterized protein n=1 Tax=Sphaerisporangium aureirubrum TaxID=1544736 RepID=A0ABW1NA08_9ACTN
MTADTPRARRPAVDEPIHPIITSLAGHMNDTNGSGSTDPQEQA